MLSEIILQLVIKELGRLKTSRKITFMGLFTTTKHPLVLPLCTSSLLRLGSIAPQINHSLFSSFKPFLWTLQAVIPFFKDFCTYLRYYTPTPSKPSAFQDHTFQDAHCDNLLHLSFPHTHSQERIRCCAFPIKTQSALFCIKTTQIGHLFLLPICASQSTILESVLIDEDDVAADQEQFCSVEAFLVLV